MVRVLVPSLLVAACLGAALLAWQQAQATGPEPQVSDGTGSGAAEIPARAPTPSPDPATVPVPQPATGAAGGGLHLPDGTEVAPLNGVRTPAPLAWGNRPFSPIVGVEHARDIDWYMHADGTRTTTIEVWRDDLGRKDAVTLVARPGEPLPVDF